MMPANIGERTMIEELEQKYEESLASLKAAGSTAGLEAWYKETLGRKGTITLMTRQVGQLSPEERPVFGKRVNEVKRALEEAHRNRLAQVRAAELEAEIAADALDVTLPGRRQRRGRLHPTTQTLREI
jgi:phenylalanyl-tRNA synthetase alpha chain